MIIKTLTLELDDDENFYLGYIMGFALEILKNDVIAQRTLSKIIRANEKAHITTKLKEK